jgi:hypothetical protein
MHTIHVFAVNLAALVLALVSAGGCPSRWFEHDPTRENDERRNP